MICTLLSRVLEDFHRILLTMFLAYFHAPRKSQQWLYYVNPKKAFFTFSLITTSYLNP